MPVKKKYTHELRYNFFELGPQHTVLEEWPKLRAYPELEQYGQNEGDLLVRYCILLTDKGSGLLSITDVALRHSEAWTLAGGAADDPRREAALDFTDPAVEAISYALLRDSDDMMLAFVLRGELLLWRDIRKLHDDNDKLFDTLPARIRELDSERNLLFKHDALVEKSVKVEARKGQATAEEMARKFRDEK